MNLIDTNTVSFMLERNIQCEDIYYMATEVNEEVAMAEVILSNKTNTNIKNISQYPFYNEILYIDFYNQMLNKHNGKSFFNMTGFGDISILATVHTIIKEFSNINKNSLFDNSETIIVFTNDIGLTNRIYGEFYGLDVKCLELESIR